MKLNIENLKYLIERFHFNTLEHPTKSFYATISRIKLRAKWIDDNERCDCFKLWIDSKFYEIIEIAEVHCFDFYAKELYKKLKCEKI